MNSICCGLPKINSGSNYVRVEDLTSLRGADWFNFTSHSQHRMKHYHTKEFRNVSGEQFEVARRILQLADSAKEGLEYAVSKSDEADFESAVQMLSDVVAAFAEIEAALPVLHVVRTPAVRKSAEALQDGFGYCLGASETHDYAVLSEVLRVTLVPRFNAWYRAINETLRLHVLS